MAKISRSDQLVGVGFAKNDYCTLHISFGKFIIYVHEQNHLMLYEQANGRPKRRSLLDIFVPHGFAVYIELIEDVHSMKNQNKGLINKRGTRNTCLQQPLAFISNHCVNMKYYGLYQH